MLRILTLLLGVTCLAQAEERLGQPPFQYRLVPGWADEALQKAPIKNGHALAFDQQGRLFVLTDEPRNNILILEAKSGKLLDTWTARMPGAHGMSLLTEKNREVLYLTDTALHEVRKLSLDGQELERFPWPEKSGLYAKAAEYRPSKTLHHPEGRFWVMDGYGKDYIHAYNAEGKLTQSWGGNVGDARDHLAHWGPHGGALDLRKADQPQIVIAMSDQQEIRRFSLEGKFLDRLPFPGGNPRDIVLWGEFTIVPHLGDQWPKDRDSPGFISILDRDLKIVSNLGAPPADYRDNVLQPMKSDGHTFLHPHAVAVDSEGNLYVAQFASPAAPLLKLERIR